MQPPPWKIAVTIVIVIVATVESVTMALIPQHTFRPNNDITFVILPKTWKVVFPN